MAVEFICNVLCFVTFAFKCFSDDSLRPLEAFNMFIWLFLYTSLEVYFTYCSYTQSSNDSNSDQSNSSCVDTNSAPNASLKSKSRISSGKDAQSLSQNATRSKTSAIHQRTTQSEGSERALQKDSDAAATGSSRSHSLQPSFGLWEALLLPLCLIHRGTRGSLEQSLMRHLLLVLPLLSITQLALPDTGAGHSPATAQSRVYRKYIASLHRIVCSKSTLVAALLTSLVLAIEFISAGVERFLNSDNFLLLLGLVLCFLVANAVFDQLLQFNALTRVNVNSSASDGAATATASDSQADSDAEDAAGGVNAASASATASGEPVNWSVDVGEAALVSQLVFLQLGSLVNALWRGASSVGPHVFLSTVLQLACLLCGGVLLFARRVPLQENLLVRRVPHLALLCLPLALFVTAARLPTSANALVSYFKSQTRLLLVAFWLVIVVISLAVPFVARRRLAKTSAGALRARISWFRKLFHLSVVMIFFPGLLYDRRFLSVAALGALFLFLYFETTRHYSLFVASSALGSRVHDAIASVLSESERDASLLLPHVYLLCGMASGLWLDAFTEASTRTSLSWSLEQPTQVYRVLALWGGLLVVGVGDASGASFGLLFGRFRWADARKTLEGTYAFFTAALGAAVLVAALTFVGTGGGFRIELNAFSLKEAFRAICTPRILTSFMGAALLEANTALYDNLPLPLFFYAMLAV